MTATPRVSPGVAAVLFRGLEDAAFERDKFQATRRLLQQAERRVSDLILKCAELRGHTAEPTESASKQMSRRRAEALLNHLTAGGPEGAVARLRLMEALVAR